MKGLSILSNDFDGLLAHLPDLLTTGQVTDLYRVTDREVRKWDKVLEPFHTPCGERRYRKEVLARVLAAHTDHAAR